MKKLTIIFVILCLTGGCAYFWIVRQASAAAPAVPDPTAKVERGDLDVTVSSTGQVNSNLDVDIKCKAGGPIIKLPYDVSDVVHKGDLLVEVDPVDEAPKIGLAKASVQAAEANLETAKENLTIAQETLVTSREHAEAALKSAVAHDIDARVKARRMAELLEKRLAAQEDYDTAQTTAVQASVDLRNAQVAIDELKTQEESLNVKRQDIKSAEAQLAQNRINLAIEDQAMLDTKVFSPMDGVVSAMDVQIGYIIASAITNVGGGTTVLTLSDLSHIFIIATVDESDIGRVKLKQDVNITADSYPNVKFKGSVVRIATKGVTVSNVVTFQVKIEVTSSNKALLKPGMTSNVEILVDRRKNVLIVPLDAVLREHDKVVSTVVTASGQTEERPVVVGINDGTQWEILKGLHEGETVVLKESEAETRWHTNPNRR